jgi:hypothetical protein
MGTCDQGTVEEILDFFYEQVCVCVLARRTSSE